MKYAFSSTLLTLLLFTGCTNSMDIPTPSGHSNDAQRYTPLPINNGTKTQSHEEKLKSYQKTMRTVASGIKVDQNYERIVLDSPAKKEWFQDITYKLWDKQISDEQFIEQGLAKYPTHRYEFKFIANGFNTHR